MFFCILLSMLAFPNGNSFVVDIPVDITNVQIEQIAGYTHVNLPAALTLSRIGVPSMPVENVLVALPPGTVATDIELVNVSYSSLGGRHLVVPATRPIPFSHFNTENLPLPVPDQTIYSSSEYFPSKAVSLRESSMLMGFPVAYVSVYPVRWNPASGTLQVITNLQIRITTEIYTDNYTVRIRSAQGEARVRTVVENAVINPSMVQRSGASIIPSRDLPYGEYVVIATQEYLEFAQQFADWKTRKGIPTNVYTTHWIQSQYSFIDLQQNIRAFLTDCRDAGVEYVLIWGDDDVIAGRDTRISLDSRVEFPPVDLYWSDINDTFPGEDRWDSNRNGIWGEWLTDDLDYHPDLFIGRASVNSIQDSEVFVEKILIYEQILPRISTKTLPIETRIGYTTGMLTASTWGRSGAQLISRMVPDKSWEQYKCYEFNHSNSTKKTIDMINSGPAYVYHASHGDKSRMYTSFGDLYTVDDIMAQTNVSNGNLPAIWNSMACGIGWFDDYECCADAWLNSPGGGGFGCFNARTGWVFGSPGHDPTNVIIQNSFKTHWVDGQQTLGAMHSLGVDKLDPLYSSVNDWSVKQYNLFGDPELPLWTINSTSLKVEYPAFTPVGASNISVTVLSNSGSPISGARVCLWKGDDWANAEVYEVENTDASGVVTIPVNTSTTGDMLVTAWAYNYISYLGSLEVGGTGIEEAVYETAIQAPYPNPAVNSATLSFSLANAGTTTIQIFDLAGRTVAVPASEDFAAGQHALNWDLTTSDGTSVPNGFYSVVITTGDTVMTERIMVLR